MSKCDICNEEMTIADGCKPRKYVFEDESELLDVKFGNDFPDVEDDERCHDCGCSKGNHHHMGCDMERCPKCGRQYISCDCKIRYAEFDDGIVTDLERIV